MDETAVPKSTAKATSTDVNAIYHDVSPTLIYGSKVFGVVTCLMVVIAFIICLVTGAKNNTFYLMATNLLISTFVGAVVTWWYRKGDLASDKIWFIILVCAVIVFQCITTEIYVFNVQYVDNDVSTPAPPRINTTAHHNMTTRHMMQQDVTTVPSF
ncbi:uncharacterized protein LOC106176894 [Lingula anatina]|uniref:Uncharacterized protein LOC106176894 n=1 Tax=Lingula anatina TaxID=7574 RepID=A0A1S3JXZ7_LINAN|nr:uncharacterized protein LOC106176894 [Lingula anatina]|eukprot:XP_013414926.1 uncharacterized protein LOC106176894 [Lingula anatina]